MTQRKNGKRGGSGLAMMGLAAAAAAGAYFLYGKEGAKRRAKIKGWTLRAKGEVLDKLETMKEVNQDAYNKVVDNVTSRYGKMKNIEASELVALTADLKRHWNNIKRQLAGPARKSPAKKKPAAKKSAGSKQGGGSK